MKTLASAHQVGFTLVELIAVITILALVSAVGGGFVVDVVNQYQKAQIRSTLVQRGTVSMEQLARKLRMVVPNSVRVSTSGNCVEFLPMIGGAFYLDTLPDAQNGLASAASVNAVEFTLAGGVPAHVVVAPMNSNEIYTNVEPSSRIAAGDFGSSPYSAAVFASSFIFLRNSSSHRLLLAANPERFCVAGNQLVRYDNYGLLTSAMSDVAPAGDTVLMADDVSASGVPFTLSVGSEDRNALLAISLEFFDRGESILLNSQVFIRNVP
jgi:MSHA biogenesis protein MshO